MNEFDEFMKRIYQEPDPGPPLILPRHATPEALLVEGTPRGTPFWRIMLAVLVANLLTIVVVVLIVLFGIGKAFSSSATPASVPDPVSVSICSPGGC